VAVTIPLGDDTGIASVAYTVRPGDHVNVISSLLFVDLDQEWQTILPNVVAPVYAPALSFAPVDPANPDAAVPAYNVPVTAQVSPASGLPYLGRTELWMGIDPTGTANTTAYYIPSEEQRPRLVSQTLIQDAIVLWVGEYPLSDEKAQLNIDQEAAEFTQAGTEEAEPVVEEEAKPMVITLVVSPQDAVTLNYMILSKANLSLALRSAGDDQRINTESVTLQFIMQQYNIPLPSPLAYGTQPGIFDLSTYEELPTYVAP
jgi:pilus assembly protein CpaB